MAGILHALWRYRGFIHSSIMTEFKIRFARSRIGTFWLIIQPLFQVMIYAVILSTVMAAKLPNINNRYGYALYLMSGTLAWSLFSEIITRALGLFIEQANLIKKMHFPRSTLPTILVGSAVLNNMMLFAAILLIFSCLGHYPSWALLCLPFLTVIMVMFAIGIGLTLGVLNVFMRDLTHIVPIFMQLLFWATPIVYPITIIPEQYRGFLKYNPLYIIVESYQNLFLYHQAPVVAHMVVMGIFSCGLLCLGFFVFRRANPEMVDVL